MSYNREFNSLNLCFIGFFYLTAKMLITLRMLGISGRGCIGFRLGFISRLEVICILGEVSL